MLMIYMNGRRFGPVAFISARFRIGDNNTTIIHDICRAFNDIMKSNCSIINNGWGFIQLEKVSQADGLETISP